MKEETKTAKKPRKKLRIFLFLIFIFIIWRFFIYEPKMYMYGNPYLIGWDKRKVEIPQEIVKAKDCEAFKRYADEKMGPDFVFSAGCPWAKIELIGHFILNGVVFNVPRAYLWQGKLDPDGLSQGLYFMFKYPNFDASSASGDQSMNIEVSITPEVKEKYLFHDKIWVDGSHWRYLSRSGVEHRLDEFLANEDLSKYIVDVPEMGMKKYILKQPLGMVYFQGNIMDPDYWIMCGGDGESTRCESSFMYKKNTLVKYSFSRKGLFEHHREIREKIINKLDEFSSVGGVK